jgi:hypothetical protein
MNLRVQSGLAHSHQTLDASSISFRPPTAVSSCGTPIFLCLLHRPVWLELRFQFPTGHQLERSLGPFNLWKQVQKEEKPVDFTMNGA